MAAETAAVIAQDGTPLALSALAWDKQGGLLPAVVQDADTLRVLMLGYMSRDALARTLETGLATFHSRSRASLWTKGESSGNVLRVRSVHADCDLDALLLLAEPAGPTCHKGITSCFGNVPGDVLAGLQGTIAARSDADPAHSYTRRLLDSGVPRIAQKVGEEGVETALAAVTDDEASLCGEAADLLYHLLVLLQARGLGWRDVSTLLQARAR
ncbi:bifunctional phosphoribosyl-AMP cyclohydrolase/phosphoribosyl-ATP diphosphatase HisIE [Luteimonas sp. e5]